MNMVFFLWAPFFGPLSLDPSFWAPWGPEPLGIPWIPKPLGIPWGRLWTPLDPGSFGYLWFPRGALDFSWFFIVFHSFWIVFHRFFKELDFKELEIHRYSLLDIHQWISMDIHQWIHSLMAINEFIDGPSMNMVSFLWALSLAPIGPPLGPSWTCRGPVGDTGVARVPVGVLSFF